MVLPLRFIIAYILFVPLYVTNYRWIPASVSLQAQTLGWLDRTLDIRASMSRTNTRQWHLTVAKMVNVLNVIIVGSTLAVSTTIALFLQPFVSDSTLLRAVTASSFLLAGASFASAFILVASKDRMIHKRDQWIEASRYPMTWTSISFWGCLTWPLTSFTWSIAISVLTILILGSVGRPNPTDTITSKMGIEGIVVIFSVMTVICFAFYRQFRFLM